MDAACRTGIDDVREIIEGVRYAPAAARYKVYIIDEVHMLSKQAFNGLLKTLEEPPPHVKFIFATTEIRKVPVTVLSRCQRFDLRRIEDGRAGRAYLAIHRGKGKVKIEDAALALIARAAEGSVRDALSLLDQAIAHGEKRRDHRAETMRDMLGLADRGRVLDLFEKVMGGKIAEALADLERALRSRRRSAGGDAGSAGDRAFPHPREGRAAAPKASSTAARARPSAPPRWPANCRCRRSRAPGRCC